MQKTRWAVKPRRAILWENAKVVGEGPAGTALAVVLRCAIVPNCAGSVSNLAKVLRRAP